MTVHLKWPLELFRGRLVTLEQDSPEDIEQCVQLIVLTKPNERVALPEFGVADQVGRTAIDSAGIADAVNQWEPRIDITDVDVEWDGSTAVVTLHGADQTVTVDLDTEG